jgi:hypothetical protein
MFEVIQELVSKRSPVPPSPAIKIPTFFGAFVLLMAIAVAMIDLPGLMVVDHRDLFQILCEIWRVFAV